MNLHTIILFISSLLCTAYSAKILGIFPAIGKSQHILGSSLIKALAEKGHDVTLISPFPQKQPHKNFRDIDTSGVREQMKPFMDNLMNFGDQGVLKALVSLFGMGLHVTNLTLKEPNVIRLIKSNEKFDLIILDVFVNEALLGFAHHFNTPVIGVSSFGANAWTCDMVGSPSPTSYVPHVLLSFTDKMSLWERMGNLLIVAFEKFYIDYFYIPLQEKLLHENFPGSKPSLYALRKEVSLVLLNTHFSISYTRPYVPNMIEVGGMHVNRKSKPLPENIKKFIESAKEGVVYFSMGSNLKSKFFPKEKREMILNLFKNLKQKVLWKWEDKELPGKPDNVLISDWFPQDDILAHPNVKLFITHGGLLSTTEAIYHGVPIVGIPKFGDQFLNMARAEKAGFGITVDYEKLENLEAAVKKVLQDNSYQRNMKAISVRYRDQPMSPMETAIYWIEYVIRHKGAPHLRSAGLDLSFVQYHNIDAFCIIFGGVFLILYLFYAMIKKLLCCGGKSDTKNKTDQKKKKH